MATFTYFVSAKKRKLAPVYLRLVNGRKTRLIADTLIKVDPQQWSNKTQTFKQRIFSTTDEEVTSKLKGLKSHIEHEFSQYYKTHTLEWLNDVIYRYHNNKDQTAKDLNSFINKFIADAESGAIKNKSALNYATGTVKVFKGFNRVFQEFQGNYSPERRKWHIKNSKELQPFRKLDFEDITIDFYNAFVSYCTDLGYKRNTIGRFINSLKLMMRTAMESKLHKNIEFTYKAFKRITEGAYSVYLTEQEIQKIFSLDLSSEPRIEKARDAFIVLCETGLRVSDYRKIRVDIRMVEGIQMIDIIQTKTGDQVIIPLRPRFLNIWQKYGNSLPEIPEQYINKYIKTIAFRCGIRDICRWEAVRYGKRYEKTAEKWELITCHTGRRTACTQMYLNGLKLDHIRVISGHKSNKQLIEYIKADALDHARQLAQYEYFKQNTA